MYCYTYMVMVPSGVHMKQRSCWSADQPGSGATGVTKSVRRLEGVLSHSFQHGSLFPDPHHLSGHGSRSRGESGPLLPGFRTERSYFLRSAPRTESRGEATPAEGEGGGGRQVRRFSLYFKIKANIKPTRLFMAKT